MINLLEEIERMKQEGYNEANAEARVCQDIILFGIANSSLSRNVTIKGGVVMRNLSKNARRATQDLQLLLLTCQLGAAFVWLAANIVNFRKECTLSRFFP